MQSSDKMERQFFSGNTLEQAVLAAARHHDLEPDRVAYKLRDKKHGFLNIRRRVVIEVDPAVPERSKEVLEPSVARGERSAKSEEPSGPLFGEPRRDGTDQPIDQPTDQPSERRQDRDSWRGEEPSWIESEQADLEAAEKAIEHLGSLAGLKLASSVQRAERGLEVEISGPDSGFLREDRGKGLDAMEHLLPRLIRGLSGEGVPCRVDSEGLRAAREEELGQLARATAEDVQRDGVERRLEPMNPADRRQVHMALADDPAVRTESEGDGFLKCVRIEPC